MTTGRGWPSTLWNWGRLPDGLGSHYAGRSWINGNVGLHARRASRTRMLGCIQLGEIDRQALSLPRVRGIRGCPFVAHGEAVDFDSLTWTTGPLRTGTHMNAHDLAAAHRSVSQRKQTIAQETILQEGSLQYFTADAWCWERKGTGWCTAETTCIVVPH